jgi:threonine dehydrogenase-like Zn-dependent dehydrogenase
MRAVVVERPGGAALREVPTPEPGPDDVLVRVGAAGICGSDVELLDGRRPAGYVRYPIIPGHEWSGTVAEVGAGVAAIEPGMKVVAEGFRSCGACARCGEGRTNLCDTEYAETGFTHAGAFADYVCVPARLIHRLPPDADLAAAALLEPAACVAQGLLEVDVRPGASVAVVGSGTLGLLAVCLLRRYSPARLALVGRRALRLELGATLGATEIWDAALDERPRRTSTSSSRRRAPWTAHAARPRSRGAAAQSSSRGSRVDPAGWTPTRSYSATCDSRASSAPRKAPGAG